MTGAEVALRSSERRRCSLCGSPTPKPGCPRCELTQRDLFSPPVPSPSPEDLAAGDADREAKLTAALEKQARGRVIEAYRALGRPVRVGLVGCAKTKRSQPCAARELYASDLFRAALRYAELATDETYILSARHELVRPDDVVAPYDETLAGKGKRGRLAWGDRVVERLAARLSGLRVYVVILAGRDYQIPVQVAAVIRGWTVETPLVGRFAGERIRWLKNEAERLSPTRKNRSRWRRAP